MQDHVITNQPDLIDPEESEEVKAYIKRKLQEREEEEEYFLMHGEPAIYKEIQAKDDSYHKRANFNKSLWCENEYIDNSIKRLCAEFELDSEERSYNPQQIFNVTKIILLNLSSTRAVKGHDYWVSYSRNKNSLDIPQRYRQSGVSYKNFCFVIDKLYALDYIDIEHGYYDRKRFGGANRSITSRMRATEKLVNNHLNNCVTAFAHYRPQPKQEFVVLKKPENAKGIKELKDYSDTIKTIKMRKALRKYNDLIHSSDISHSDFAFSLKYCIGSKLVLRIFNNNKWTHGGRFYGGWWQNNIRKKSRQGITIDGKPTIELDFKGYHPFMLYQMQGVKWEDGFDPYSLPQYNDHLDKRKIRNLLKEMLLIWLNASDKNEAWGAVEGAIKQDISSKENRFPRGDMITSDSLTLLGNQFLKHNTPIAGYFFSGIGIELQNKDSHIAELVIKAMTAEGKLVLCMHDSFICDARYEDELRELMISSYCKIMKTDKAPTITKEDYQ